MVTFTSDTFQALNGSHIKRQSQDHLLVTVPSTGGVIQLNCDQYQQEMWNDFSYVVADIYHESHDVIVIIFRFTQLDGKYIDVHFGLLPNVKTRLCFPLKALNGEKLFLDRYPGVLQTVLRGDSSIDRSKIDGFYISTIPSTVKRHFELTTIHLSKDEPNFDYSSQPYIDELGQLMNKQWDGKIESSDTLTTLLQNEWKHYQNTGLKDDAYSRYGGWKQLQFKRTGFFRTENDGENWWFVDPEGYAVFSLGIDCMRPNNETRIKGMEHLISWLPEKSQYGDAWNEDNFDYTIANLIRAFGDDWYTKWAELNTARLKDWKVNTIGNWSDEGFIQISGIPYVFPMVDFPSTAEKIYRDFPDVFSPEYEQNSISFAKQLIPLKNDPLLIGYFMRNEPHWAFVDKLNLTEMMVLHPRSFVSKQVFINKLKQKYETVTKLNHAWKTTYEDFHDLEQPEKIQLTDVAARYEDFNEFHRMLIRRYVEIPAHLCKKMDPNHLNLGMRYAWVANDDILEGCETFDVFSINSYQLKPDAGQIRLINDKLNMPVMIGEFHFGAADVGMLAYGIRATKNQHDRGLAYRYYVEQGATIPGLIGVHYFQFNDQSALGRFDGENYQIGIVDTCNQPYHKFIEQMKIAHERVYKIRTGEILPLSEPPEEIPKTGF